MQERTSEIRSLLSSTMRARRRGPSIYLHGVTRNWMGSGVAGTGTRCLTGPGLPSVALACSPMGSQERACCTLLSVGSQGGLPQACTVAGSSSGAASFRGHTEGPACCGVCATGVPARTLRAFPRRARASGPAFLTDFSHRKAVSLVLC